MFSTTVALSVALVFVISIDYIRADCSTTGCLNGVCVNITTPACQCFPGFVKSYVDVTNCQDLDECTIGYGTICGHGRCVNTPGSFRCSCYPGFVPMFNATTCQHVPRPQQLPTYQYRYNPMQSMQNMMQFRMYNDMF